MSHDVDLDRVRRREAPPPKTVGRRDVRRFLDGCSREELVEQVMHLFASFGPVREYYQMRLAPADDETTTRAKYKKIIENEFFPPRGFGRLRLSVARKAVADYREVAGSTEGIADLLFYVETGVAFANTYGDMPEQCYLSMDSMYHDAVLHIAKHGLEERFRARCRKLVEQSSRCGYGLGDCIAINYAEYLDPDGEFA